MPSHTAHIRGADNKGRKATTTAATALYAIRGPSFDIFLSLPLHSDFEKGASVAAARPPPLSEWSCILPPPSLMCVLRSSAPPTVGAREPAAHVMRCMGAMPIALQITRSLDRGSLLPLPLPFFFQHRSPLHSAV